MTQSNALIPAHAERPAAVAHVAVEQQQYLTFSLGEEMFGLGILSVREILEFGQITEVPLVPAFIQGVINLRGAVVPVINLAVRFGRQAGAITKRTCIVIIEISHEQNTHQMGLVVDAVSEVLEIPSVDIEPPPAFGSRIRTDFIAGMGKVNSKFVVLLNVDQILSLDEITVLSGLPNAH
ncbi:MAG: chemotaxis protein CheW [Corticimicrobacter sp.]|uniref:chemotaxis protein CheW n=1 Tax=Corticimicrobacter sp. TaxID=2678536 RepID=UPI0032DBB2EE